MNLYSSLQLHILVFSRYGLFQQHSTEGGAIAGGGVGAMTTIPYIQREGGPRSSDLLLITKILNAMEKDDGNVSKLISDYVLQCKFISRSVP